MVKFENKEIRKEEIKFYKVDEDPFSRYHLQILDEIIVLSPAEIKRLQEVWKNGLGSREIFNTGEGIVFFVVSCSADSPQWVWIGLYDEGPPNSYVFDRSYIVDYALFMEIIQ